MLAKKESEDFHSNENVLIPSPIKVNLFFQFAADNIDRLEETLDGKETFHATQMVIYQRGVNEGNQQLSISQEKTLKLPTEFHSIHKASPFKTGHPVLQFCSTIGTDHFKPTKNLKSEAKYFAHVLCRIKEANSQQVIPSWTALNQLSTLASKSTPTIASLPIINAPAHEKDTLWTVIMRALKITLIKNPQHSTVLTLDEQLYSRAKEFQWNDMDTCKSLVLRLGSFHIILNYMKVIGKHFKDSALEDVWIESSTSGENMAHNNIR